MTLAWPWLLLALPLPWLLRRFWPDSITGAILRVPDASSHADAPHASNPRTGARLALLIWLLLIAAATRPQWLGEALPVPVTGRDLMLVVDVSDSMATTDLAVRGTPANRLQVVKAFTDDFLQQREGDRVGLVVFGKQAYLHTPLSWDINALRESLAGIEPGLAGRETALGDALALATSRLREQAGSHRVIILLTDGAQTAGELSPRQGAWLAQREGIGIHAVGIGATSTATDAAATDEALDASTLRAIADLTGGTYQSVVNAADLQTFYDTLDALAPGTQGNAALRELRELYPWPLALALALGGILLWRREQTA